MPEWKNSPDDTGMPSSAPKALASWYAQGLSDGLGDRLLMFDNSTAPSLELLRFRSDLAQVPGFEAALRERVRQLSDFRHPAFARVRAVQRLEPDDDLALVSNCTPGKRLSEILHKASGPGYAAALIRQLAPALVQLQQHDHGLSHGALSPDRIVVSPEGRLTIVEHVVGPAVDALNLGAAQLARLGIAVPPMAAGATPRLDVATDWYQLGLVAVSVLIGRPVTASELPQLQRLLDNAGASARQDRPGLSPFVREWLDRALQLSGTPIGSGLEARVALDELLRKEQRRDVRRVESSPVAQAPAQVQGDPEPVTAPREVVAAPVVAIPAPAAEPIRTTLAERFPAELPPRPVAPERPTHVRSLFGAVTPSDAEVRSGAESAPTTAAVRETQPEPAPPAWKKRDAPSRRGAPRRDPVAARGTELHAREAPKEPVPDPPERHGFSTAFVGALVLIAVVEGGVIAWLARALWLAPPPAMAVQTVAPGENAVITNRPSATAPLRLTTAPDLQWVRVTSAAAPGMQGAAAAATAPGIIRIASPIKLRVLEGSRQLGTVPGADLRLAAGRHDIELVNVALGYSLKQSLEVEAGQTVVIHVAPPQGRLTLYAVPPADVSVDGQPVGRTPLGPLPIELGEHTVTFRHATGARDRQRVTVKAGETVRVIGNLRRR
jgi:hypothetical protein